MGACSSKSATPGLVTVEAALAQHHAETSMSRTAVNTVWRNAPSPLPSKEATAEDVLAPAANDFGQLVLLRGEVEND